jgi:glutaredoxin
MNSQDEKSPTDPLLTDQLEVTLYTRPGCHLCDEAKLQMAPLLAEFGARLREVNIDADPELRELYSLDVPVIFLADRKIAKHRVDPAQFRRQLVEARRRSAQRY